VLLLSDVYNGVCLMRGTEGENKSSCFVSDGGEGDNCFVRDGDGDFVIDGDEDSVVFSSGDGIRGATGFMTVTGLVGAKKDE
jgi:hypothetical protein